MTHLILCREYPPAPYPAGGIGTYARHMARLLADAGETVHLIAQRWDGAPERISRHCDRRLILHRISVEEPLDPPVGNSDATILKQLASSTCPTQLFSWQAAHYAERLIESEVIDVVEAQEWEAPLYYLQVRRALGLGPRRQPPLLVHLHSPSQMIFKHNEWDTTLTDYLPLTRFEEYTIRASDALVCPSHYLAKGVTELFVLEPGRIEVIPYPMGETPLLERSAEVWANNSICYVGRLELRKGVVEWVDAAVSVAATHASVSFDFFGSDTSLRGGAGNSVLDYLRRRIPKGLHSRFHFHGSRSRAGLLSALAHTAIAVVPSRWENLPFTCIEAMATGLPVLVSPNGGMAELVADGESGWVAKSGAPADLAEGLLRALATTAIEREAMGRRACETVRERCGNATVLAQQLDLRQRVAQTGATRSRLVPGPGRTAVANVSRAGLGVVAVCFERPERIPDCIASIVQQNSPAKAVVVVEDGLETNSAALFGSAARQLEEPSIVYVPDKNIAAAWRLGLKTLLADTPGLRCVTWIDQDVRLEAAYAASCESVFNQQPQVGVIVPWTFTEGKQGDLDPGPVSPSGVMQAVLPRGAAIRVEALLHAQQAGVFEVTSSWAALSAAGWASVTFPEALVHVFPAAGGGPVVERRYSGMALIASGSPQLAMRWFLAASWPEKARWIGHTLRHPQRVTQWIYWQLRRKS